jgi:hypothetical protein
LLVHRRVLMRDLTLDLGKANPWPVAVSSHRIKFFFLMVRGRMTIRQFLRFLQKAVRHRQVRATLDPGLARYDANGLGRNQLDQRNASSTSKRD